MKKVLIACMLFVGLATINAQDWYSDVDHTGTLAGYVITEDGTRIDANMVIKNPWDLANGIWFAHPDKQKEGKKEKIRYYKAGEFKEIGFEGNKFVYKKLPNFSKYNLYVLLEGPASYYECYVITDTKNVIEYYIEVNGKIYAKNDVRFMNFKKFGAKVFGDCPELKTKIENGEYKFIHFDAVVEEYNTLMAK